jgi:hypothetical protein
MCDNNNRRMGWRGLMTRASTGSNDEEDDIDYHLDTEQSSRVLSDDDYDDEDDDN